MSSPYKSWNDVRMAAESFFATYIASDTSENAKTAFDADTIQNVHDFIDYATDHLPLPDEVSEGYWPTINLYWKDAKPYSANIEIFGNDFEFMRFIPLIVDVQEFEHLPGTPFPTEFAEILSAELR